jgi:two-component system, NarL family, response regulator NreC
MSDDKKISIFIADDHNLVRQGIVALLKNCDDFIVIGEASDGMKAVSLVKELNPDVVIMDISMPSLNGLEATYQIKREMPEIKILILTQHENEEYVIRMMKAGADGYILKNSVSDDLVNGIRALEDGEKFFSSSISKLILDEYIGKIKGKETKTQSPELTHREREVLQLLAEGDTNQQVAERLFISVRTVEFHRSNIMHKLDLHDLASLVKYAINKGIIQLNS